MTTVLTAIYDGEVFRLEKPLQLEPNTRVRIIIETIKPAKRKKCSFFKTAQSLNLEGPEDWSVRFEDYLYGGDDIGENRLS